MKRIGVVTAEDLGSKASTSRTVDALVFGCDKRSFLLGRTKKITHIISDYHLLDR
jgi:hypothetical protein